MLPSPAPQIVVPDRPQLSNELSLIKIPLIMDWEDVQEPLISKNHPYSLLFLWCLTQIKTKQLPILYRRTWRLITFPASKPEFRLFLFLHVLSTWGTLGIDRMPSAIFYCVNFSSSSVSIKAAMISKPIHFRLYRFGTIICLSLDMGEETCM